MNSYSLISCHHRGSPQDENNNNNKKGGGYSLKQKEYCSTDSTETWGSLTSAVCKLAEKVISVRKQHSCCWHHSGFHSTECEEIAKGH